jgi:hypothetical protein
MKPSIRTLVFVVLVVVVVFCLVPRVARAQEATMIGTVSDATGATIVGATVTALHLATGNTFVGMTDSRGAFRILVRVGTYTVSAEASGFATQRQTSVDIQVGQELSLDFKMVVSSVSQSVQVTAAPALVNTESSEIGSNLNPQQVSEIPLNGRQWLDLTLLAPGSQGNDVTSLPIATITTSSSGLTELGGGGGAFQIYLDGQEMTQVATTAVGYDEVSFSRDAIAEFQYVSSRPDASFGRSDGVVINAVTKSGGNQTIATVAGYFRSSDFNWSDFITHTVLPFSDQQLSGTVGGPIIKDKLFYFANFEYERSPQTYTFDSPFPAFNIPLEAINLARRGGGRLDYRLSNGVSLFVRGTYWASLVPINASNIGGSSLHPSAAASFNEYQKGVWAGLTQVISSRSVNQIRGGYDNYNTQNANTVNMGNYPTIILEGYQIGPGNNTTNTIPFLISTPRFDVRDDFSHTFTAGGEHSLRVGVEYQRLVQHTNWCFECRGALVAESGPIPANIESDFPVYNDPSTWNYAALSSIATYYVHGFGNFSFLVPKHLAAAYAQDDWQITHRLTLNLGVRYDIQTDPYGNSAVIPPFLSTRPLDKTEVQPRLGATFRLNDRTVIRGGWGRYSAEVLGQSAIFTQALSQQFQDQVFNNGSPTFAANPLDIPGGYPDYTLANLPTYAQAQALSCAVSDVPGCIKRSFFGLADYSHLPYSQQWSIGVQRQFGSTWSFTADFVDQETLDSGATENANLTWVPQTGVPGCPVQTCDVSLSFFTNPNPPFPDYGLVSVNYLTGNKYYDGYYLYRALETSLTKRLSSHWQLAATYTFGGSWSQDPRPLQASTNGTKLVFTPLPDPVSIAEGGQYGYAITDQRHRLVLNGIWQLPHGFELSGLNFFGSGVRYPTVYEADLFGELNATGRLTPQGTIVPRDGYVGAPVWRVDARLLKTFKISEKVSFDGLVEMFNIFDHANYGAYNTTVGSAAYGMPFDVINEAYVPREVQLGFRATF